MTSKLLMYRTGNCLTIGGVEIGAIFNMTLFILYYFFIFNDLLKLNIYMSFNLAFPPFILA